MKVAGAVVLAMAVFALVTIARINRYCPQETLVPHLSAATKVNENRAGHTSEAAVRGFIQLCRGEELASVPMSFREILIPKAVLILWPFHFRPPPRFV